MPAINSVNLIFLQVVKMSNATNMYTKQGLEVRSFSQLRNIFFTEDTFVLSLGPARVKYVPVDPTRLALLYI